MSNNIIYILDFDGVLCDSIDECMLTTYNAFNHTELINIDDIPDQFKLYFYKYRYHVRPAKEYLLICKAYLKNKDLSYPIFVEMRKSYEKEMKIFEDGFFNKRKFLKKNIDIWLSYHKIYEHANQIISSLSNKFFILTTKDRNSVEMLANHFGFSNKVENIFSKEISTNKSVLFTYFFKQYHSLTNGNQVIFVDDNEFHLADVKHFPLELFFAKWGYAGSQKLNNFKEINSLMELI